MGSSFARMMTRNTAAMPLIHQPLTSLERTTAMKYLITVLLAFFGWSINAEAQFDKILDRAKRKTEQRVDRAIDKGIDKGLDGVEGTAKEGVKKKDKEGAEEPDQQEASTDAAVVSDKEEGADGTIRVWTERYDFQAGAEIIFYDAFEDEEAGEIPSKWAYTKGVLEVAEVDGAGKAVIGDLHTHPNWPSGFTLPSRYTIEYDVWMYPEDFPNQYSYRLDFHAGDYDHALIALTVRPGAMDMGNLYNGRVPDQKPEDARGKWAHISLSVNGNSVKGYYDQYRMFNVRLPGDARPDLFSLSTCCPHPDHPYAFLVDNVKVAAGAHPRYKEEVLKGRIVTHNILFGSDRSDLLPRSYAEIKRIADLMKEDEGIRFRVEGHTDNEGSDEHNRELSKARASAVVKALVDMGIEGKRLQAEGKGEQEPTAPNDTPEGKAKNRRVVFVKV